MNTKKGKGKNRLNKPPNPNPPQKVEVEPPKKDDPVIENLDNEIKTEDCVPEIVTEVVAPSEEEKTVDEPKKPKRNRGKKKKHEIEESSDDKIEEHIAEVSMITTTSEESKDEVIETKTSDTPQEVPNVAPTARKKKNKNKNANAGQIISEEAENIPKKEEIKEVLPVDVSDSSMDLKCDVSPKQEEDIKPAKKKNKKKKRHESEKSDKGEEISCTAAFQQLLGKEDETANIKEMVTEIKFQKITEDISDKPQEDISDENMNKGNKSKKKGKKDKHNTIKSDIKEEVQQPIETLAFGISEDTPQKVADIIKSEDVLVETVVISGSAPDEAKPTIEDFKLKAKIAKPVDKKRKEKSNQALKEGELSENVTEMPKSDELTSTVIGISVMKQLLQEQPKCKEMCAEEKPALLENISSITSISECATLPQSRTGKNTVKSPEPFQKQQPKTEELETKEREVKKLETQKEIIAESEINSTETTSEQVKEKSALPDTLRHKVLETPIEVTNEPEFIEKPVSETSQEFISHEKLSSNILEVKSGKRRKKSPKPITKLEITEEKEPDRKDTKSATISELPINPTENVQTPIEAVKILDRKQEKTDLFIDMPQIEDIEISSVKADESEGSIAEILPDVQYPRAASQQRVDNNNNTIIREIVSPGNVKLGIPVFVPDTPFVQGGEIPLTSPELVASGIRVIDVESNVVKPSEEKTDIKSKMMEVNQDMEELRLSIERSLAELTSMEKTEENIEKQFETKNKVEEVKSDPCKSLPQESKGEKSEIAESAISIIQKKPMEAIMPAPSPSPKKEKRQTEDTANPSLPIIPLPPPLPKEVSAPFTKEQLKPVEVTITSEASPICPPRKDNKGKGKSKKKGKQDPNQVPAVTETTSSSAEVQLSKESSKDTKIEDKQQQKSDNSQENAKKQSDYDDDNKDNQKDTSKNEASGQVLTEFEPIESFEDAMTSSIDDVNQSFEMIASESAGSNVNPEINIIAPTEDAKSNSKVEKQNPVTPPKNLLGHPVIPVRSNRMDYKKEKNKAPNTILAKVKIKDSIEIESRKQSKESQTENIKKLMQKKSGDESITTLNENEEFVYKYSFRKVFLPNVCHVCKKELKPMRVSCNYCHLLFYCNQKHKDEDWPQHQAFCFAVSTIVHLKDQKHIYEDAAAVTGHNYRLLRMQMIVSCEKILKRKLVPWEQEALLYPRVCGDVQCREWRLNKLADCDGCGQIAYCSSHPEHLPKSHQRWCKSYSLYQKLVCYQQTRGRLEPKLPSRVMSGQYQMPDKINEVLAAMYEEKIDMNDVEYAALTQLATAPLSAVYSFQLYNTKMNSIYANGTFKKTCFTIHVVGAELQFEADALNKWEVFFLHLRPDIVELSVSLVAPDLNPSNLPLDLLGKVRLCEQCRRDKRRLQFSFQDKKTYSEYYRSDEFTTPDIVCAFNPSIQRSTVYNGRDTWPATISCILKQKVPFIITSYTLEELRRDLTRVKDCADVNVISEPKYNAFASVRPDRNFISDDEIPLLFKNYCFAVISGVF